LDVKIEHIENPRIEAEAHYYNPKHTGLLDLGLKPHYLSEHVLLKMMEFVIKHKSQIRTDQIYRNVKWT
jgi:UDP-sulfoquinovose synthase